MDNEADRAAERGDATVPDGPASLDRSLASSLDPDTDLDELRDGGPTQTPGAMTTTGGTAGPASMAGLRARPTGAGPTTTGDAGSGGMQTSSGGSTSDATTTGGSRDTVTGGSDDDRDGG